MLHSISRRSASCTALSLLVLALAPGAARAEPTLAAEQPHPLEDDPAYQRAVEQALHEYQLGNFSEAKAFFAQAHALSPNARTLRGLGMSAYELRNYVDAIAYFEQALEASQRPLTPSMRTEVAQLLAQARSFITRLTLTLQPRTTEVRVDTRPVRPDASGVILLDPGEHELLFALPEREPITRNLRTDGGESLSMSVSFPAPQHAETPAAPAPLPLTAAAPAGSSTSLAPWFVIGGGAAVAIAGGVFLGVALSDKASVEHPDARDGGLPYYPNYAGAEKRVFPFSVIGISGLGLGVASMIAGLLWKIGDAGERAPTARLQATPTGVRFSARF
jgi:hypothetical protein